MATLAEIATLSGERISPELKRAWERVNLKNRSRSNNLEELLSQLPELQKRYRACTEPALIRVLFMGLVFAFLLILLFVFPLWLFLSLTVVYSIIAIKMTVRWLPPILHEMKTVGDVEGLLRRFADNSDSLLQLADELDVPRTQIKEASIASVRVAFHDALEAPLVEYAHACRVTDDEVDEQEADAEGLWMELAEDLQVLEAFDLLCFEPDERIRTIFAQCGAEMKVHRAIVRTCEQ